ncbi:MAG: flippase-like domain-containing protein [Acidobacteria bacterium]|nr:flippase-like domain-containing protein [Acidobacteriota bacterium]
MAEQEPEVVLARGSRHWQGALGCLLGAACLAWVLHDVEMAGLARSFTNLRWGWLALAVVFDILSYASQGWRWELLLRPLGRLSVVRTTQAIYVGLFTNEVLPLRFGEIVRAYLVSRWLNVGFSRVLPSMALERLFDCIWLAVAVGTTAIFVDLPSDLMQAEDYLGLAVLAATALFTCLVFRKPPAVPPKWKPLRWLAHFGEELQRIGRSRAFYTSFAASFVLLAAQALAYWLVMAGCGLDRSFWTGAVVYLIVRLGTAVPNAPANVGTFQFFTVVGLTLFGVDKTTATGFSLVVFLVLTVPLWALGLLALNRSGTTLHALRREILALRTRKGEAG